MSSYAGRFFRHRHRDDPAYRRVRADLPGVWLGKFPQALVANYSRAFAFALLDRAKTSLAFLSSKRNDTMLRQFSSRLPARARASCSRVLGQASRISLVPRRSMATVKVEGIPKV